MGFPAPLPTGGPIEFPGNLPPAVKPLFGRLLRADLGGYLASPAFDRVLGRLGLDGPWERSLSWVKNNGVGSAERDLTEAEEAFGVFLSLLHAHNEFDLRRPLKMVLEDLARQSPNRLDLQPAIQAARDLGVHVKVEDAGQGEPGWKPENQLRQRLAVGYREEPGRAVFLASDREPDRVYRTEVQPALEMLGLTCRRVTPLSVSRLCLDDTWEEIQRSEVVICDLRRRDPETFYGLGLAHALDRRVVVLLDSGTDLPLDLRRTAHVCCPSGDGTGGQIKEAIVRLLADELGPGTSA